ncbi:MAG: polysaccharide deacetylase [Alphaproteobacteria bacterium]|nr:polysaccharide deacetylase [Alphaproteobacteria bacterium]
MALPESYLQYPRRGPGMDHDFYAWSPLPNRKPIRWPQGARIALWVNLTVEHFPLDAVNKPFLPPGGLERAYPDLWNYTLHDYGNRVGVYRLYRMLEGLGLKATVAMNAAIADRYPFLVQDTARRGHEIMACGVDMNRLHHSGLAIERERESIGTSVETLRRASGQKVRGWMSPAKAESFNTLGLLREHGIDYVCDWPNDDLPYPLTGPAAGLHAMPHASELSDLWCLHQWHHTTDEFAQQIGDQFRLLHAEAAKSGGRVMSLTLHPWIAGQPHRIRPIREALAAILRHAGVWNATGAEILDAFKAQPG